jgi:hypothetical protein
MKLWTVWIDHRFLNNYKFGYGEGGFQSFDLAGGLCYIPLSDLNQKLVKQTGWSQALRAPEESPGSAGQGAG